MGEDAAVTVDGGDKATDAGSNAPWPECDECTASAPLSASSPWPKFRANMRQTGATRLVPVRSHARPFSYRTRKGIFSSPIVGSDGAVYVGSADRSFYALEHDGTLRFKVDTGEIIDSAGLLDDRGRVYFASGDGILRALDAKTGDERWRFHAEDPSVNKALINWFEGNVAIGPNGQLYTPNDNFSVYALDRDNGKMAWRWSMNDQTWSLPAVDPESGTLYMGNNYIAGLDVVGLFYKNIFAVDAQGKQVWRQGVNATVAASPLLLNERVYMGAFDGYLRAYDTSSGSEKWSAPTIDHVYASPALLPNGDLVQPSADGTVYSFAADTGAVRWRFDTREPIRSSPAVDGEGHIYFGGGDGRLYALNADGTRRFSIQLVQEDRNDLNASPAIGFDAIYIGSENGEIWSVPYDYCLHGAGLNDGRCETSPTEDLPENGARLYFVSPFGSSLDEPPASIARNQPLAFSLFVREKGDTELALIDESSLEVELTPSSETRVIVSGDRRFFTITPTTELSGAQVSVHVTGKYLIHPTRAGLKLTGGQVGGSFEHTFNFALESGKEPSGLPVPAHAGDPQGTLEIYRSAVPLPTILPSYNQIGFDSLHYLVGFVEGAGEQALGWVIGGMLDAQGKTVVDPTSKVLFPVTIRKKDGLMTFENQSGFTVNAMNADIPFDTFRASVMWREGEDTPRVRGLHVTTDCRNIPTYGSFLVALGFCNPDTGMMNVFGSFDMRKHGTGVTNMPDGVGAVSFDVVPATLTSARKLRATLTNTALKLSEHNLGLFAIDADTGRPLTLSYGLSTERSALQNGTISTVMVPLTGAVPTNVRLYLMVDTYPVASASLRLQ
jgi:outer membrane protein assembly factor BamB